MLRRVGPIPDYVDQAVNWWVSTQVVQLADLVASHLQGPKTFR
jgi:hypothetical protein